MRDSGSNCHATVQGFPPSLLSQGGQAGFNVPGFEFYLNWDSFPMLWGNCKRKERYEDMEAKWLKTVSSYLVNTYKQSQPDTAELDTG